MKSKYLLLLITHFFCVFLVLRIFFYIAPSFLTNSKNNGINFASVALVGWFAWQFTKRRWLNKRVLPDGKAILITGCDRGFGHALAIRFDSLGYHVFASCLNPSGSGAQELLSSCSSRLQILELDVTSDESLQSTLIFVKENLGTSELWAVVNNAGIMKGLSVEFTPLQVFEDHMAVNLYGLLRVSKAFLPLLRQSKGRIINFTSLIGRMTLPHMTAYTMSKFAAVGLTECVRQEMDIWGVPVISIEPEIYKTGLTDKTFWNKQLESNLEDLDEAVKTDYGDDYFKSFNKYLNFFIDMASPNTESVIDCVESALCLVHPDRIYSPRRNAFFRCFLYIHKTAPLVVQDFFVKMFLFRILFKNLRPVKK